jgi:formylglycine-generating enzyme required for sulfatase activity
MLAMRRYHLSTAVRLIATLLLTVPAAGAKPAASLNPKEFVQKIPGSDISFEMVAVPGGTFRMGSPESEAGRKEDEGPQVEVEVEPFYIGRHEVTWAEYDLFVSRYMDIKRLDWDKQPVVPEDRRADAVTYPTPLYELEGGPILDRMGRGGRFPAVSMSQFDARQYTKWLSKKTGRFYRLPTEAEWEYACRAGSKAAYCFGNEPEKLKDYAWYFDNSEKEDGLGAYREVGKKKPNAWGLHDMHGNVAEWCVDQYDPRRYARLTGWWKLTASEAILWPNKKHPRVIRGGGFESEAAACRSAARFGSSKDEVDHHNVLDLPESPHWSSSAFWLGFRVVSPAREPTEAEKLRFWNADDLATINAIQREREAHELIEPPAPSK